jgi:hypothetical protein
MLKSRHNMSDMEQVFLVHTLEFALSPISEEIHHTIHTSTQLIAVYVEVLIDFIFRNDGKVSRSKDIENNCPC